jgi:two-component system, LytTR family, sensor kinase
MNPAGVYTDKHDPKHHALFWMGWVVSFTMLQSMGQGSSAVLYWLTYYLVTLPVFIIHTYLIAYWLVPQIFMKNRYFLFSTMLIVLLVVFSVAELLISTLLIDRFFYPERLPDSGYLGFKNIIISGIGNHYIILVFLAVKAGKAWYRSQNMERDEQMINLDAGFEIYLYQLQPRMMYHLMKLLGRVIKAEPQNAPEMIIRISGFLNRFLKHAAREQATLLEEMNLVEEYFGLYDSVPGCQQEISCKIRGDLSSIKVPSCLFLPVFDAAVNSCNGIAGSCSADTETIDHGFRLHIMISNHHLINQEDQEDVDMLQRRLQRSFRGNFQMSDETSEGCRKIEMEVFDVCCN